MDRAFWLLLFAVALSLCSSDNTFIVIDEFDGTYISYHAYVEKPDLDKDVFFTMPNLGTAYTCQHYISYPLSTYGWSNNLTFVPSDFYTTTDGGTAYVKGTYDELGNWGAVNKPMTLIDDNLFEYVVTMPQIVGGCSTSNPISHRFKICGVPGSCSNCWKPQWSVSQKGEILAHRTLEQIDGQDICVWDESETRNGPWRIRFSKSTLALDVDFIDDVNGTGVAQAGQQYLVYARQADAGTHECAGQRYNLIASTLIQAPKPCTCQQSGVCNSLCGVSQAPVNCTLAGIDGVFNELGMVKYCPVSQTSQYVCQGYNCTAKCQGYFPSTCNCNLSPICQCSKLCYHPLTNAQVDSQYCTQDLDIDCHCDQLPTVSTAGSSGDSSPTRSTASSSTRHQSSSTARSSTGTGSARNAASALSPSLGLTALILILSLCHALLFA